MTAHPNLSFLVDANSLTLGEEPRLSAHLLPIVEADPTIQARLIARDGILRRVKPFWRTPIDLRVAQYGGYFRVGGDRSYQPQPVICAALAGAVLLGNDGVVIFKELALPDTVRYLSDWLPESLVAAHTSADYIRLRKPVPSVSAGLPGLYFCGFTGGWRNYAHWMTECLPRLIIFGWIKAELPELKIVLPELAPGSFQQQTLDLLAIEAGSICQIGSASALAFETLFVVNAIDLWSVPRICRLAAQVLSARAGLRRSVTKEEVPRRVYIHRETATRRVLNFDDIQAVCAANDLAIVSFENVPLQNQIDIMSSAELVVAEHGAGLANLLFAPTGANVLEVFSPACVQPAFWSAASISGQGYGFVVGSSVSLTAGEVASWNSNYRVDRDFIARAVEGACVRAAPD